MRGLTAAALALLALGPSTAAHPAPTTPIEHLIVVIGENLSFDNLFGTYQPKSGGWVHNLLSQDIVNRDGSPGPNFAQAAQRRAEVRGSYEVSRAISVAMGGLHRPGRL